MGLWVCGSVGLWQDARLHGRLDPRISGSAPKRWAAGRGKHAPQGNAELLRLPVLRTGWPSFRSAGRRRAKEKMCMGKCGGAYSPSRLASQLGQPAGGRMRL